MKYLEIKDLSGEQKKTVCDLYREYEVSTWIKFEWASSLWEFWQCWDDIDGVTGGAGAYSVVINGEEDKQKSKALNDLYAELTSDENLLDLFEDVGKKFHPETLEMIDG